MTKNSDEGITMIEVVVSLTLMAVLMTVFTTAVLDVYRTYNRTEALSIGQSQLNTAFLRLDKEVRYASGISQPAKNPAGDWFVEYLNTSSGSDVCTQLRLSTTTSLLQRRTWTRNRTPITPTAWSTLAWGVGPIDAGSAPFTFLAADPSNASGGSAPSNFHRLRIALASRAGPVNRAVTATATVTFTALNTSLATTSAGTCTEGRTVA